MIRSRPETSCGHENFSVSQLVSIRGQIEAVEQERGPTSTEVVFVLKVSERAIAVIVKDVGHGCTRVIQVRDAVR